MSEKKSKTIKQLAEEKEVEEMLENWDITYCARCGKRISILTCAKDMDDYGNEAFICWECAKW